MNLCTSLNKRWTCGWLTNRLQLASLAISNAVLSPISGHFQFKLYCKINARKWGVGCTSRIVEYSILSNSLIASSSNQSAFCKQSYSTLVHDTGFLCAYIFVREMFRQVAVSIEVAIHYSKFYICGYNWQAMRAVCTGCLVFRQIANDSSL